MGKLTAEEAKLTGWLSSQQDAMLELLRELVNIDSGSYDKAGVEQVGQRLIRFFEANGLVVALEPHETFAPAMHVGLDAVPAHERPTVRMGRRETVVGYGAVAREALRVRYDRDHGTD